MTLVSLEPLLRVASWALQSLAVAATLVSLEPLLRVASWALQSLAGADFSHWTRRRVGAGWRELQGLLEKYIVVAGSEYWVVGSSEYW